MKDYVILDQKNPLVFFKLKIPDPWFSAPFWTFGHIVQSRLKNQRSLNFFQMKQQLLRPKSTFKAKYICF